MRSAASLPLLPGIEPPCLHARAELRTSQRVAGSAAAEQMGCKRKGSTASDGITLVQERFIKQ